MSDLLDNSTMKGIEEIDEALMDFGFVIDIDSALEDMEGTFTEDGLIDLYKQIYRAIKLLLLSENLDREKLEQAMYLAQNLK